MEAQTPNPEKRTISSKLLSMKFMQRGVASEAFSPTTPTATDDRSAKRRKSSHVVTPGEVAPPVIDQKAVQAALEEEEKRRQALIKKQAEEAGDAHWVLPGPFPLPSNGKPLAAPLKVRYLSQAQIDHQVSDEEDSDDDDGGSVWRKKPVFRRYNMPERKPVASPSTTGQGEQDSDDSDGSDSNHSPRAGKQSGDQKLKRKRSSSELSTRRKSESARARQFADQRRKKEVNLNQLQSISGGAPRGSFSKPPAKCFRCGQMGHIKSECPQKNPRTRS